MCMAACFRAPQNIHGICFLKLGTKESHVYLHANPFLAKKLGFIFFLLKCNLMRLELPQWIYYIFGLYCFLHLVWMIFIKF
jgi:hypothetical protein